MTRIETLDELHRIYGDPGEASLVKVSPTITPHYQTLIEASPFATLATSGPEGLDCSPRGDKPGFVRVMDARTLAMPDRRGNNRVDSLRNIVRDRRAGLLFLLPGSGTTLRVNGAAHLDTDPDLLASFAIEGKVPRSVITVTLGEIYFQCARAIVRSSLWDPACHVVPSALPSPGQILAEMSQHRVGGEEYDREWPARAAASMW